MAKFDKQLTVSTPKGVAEGTSSLKSQGAVTLGDLTSGFMNHYLREFLALERVWAGLGETPWSAEQFLVPRPLKWELSGQATIDGLLVGYTIASAPEPDSAYLHKILVDDTYGGRGIGRLLYARLRETCRDHGIARLTFKSRTDNTNAHRIYERFGCRIVGEELSPDGVLRYSHEDIL